MRLLILFAGILVGQVALYGPSLAGFKILLPLDILNYWSAYTPVDPNNPPPYPYNLQFVDLVFNAEPTRVHLGAELRAGRFPLWNPLEFAGSPDISPKFSPFLLLGALVVSPKILPWIELLKALVGGLGAYCFCRRGLRVAFWPAAIVGWCFPLTGFFVLWPGYNTSAPALWLPWLLLAVHQTVLGTKPFAVAGLSVATGLVLLAGQLDVAGQVLLTSGFYALWCLADAWRRKRWAVRRLAPAAGFLTVGWVLGFLLAMPYMLPLAEYAQTGARAVKRVKGVEERPPIGLAALPQVVLPKLYGTSERGSYPDFPPRQGNLAESSPSAYAGMLATLFLAPLAWCRRRYRSLNFFWLGLAFFALSWCLNIPVMVSLLRLPGLNLMSHNRFVFAAAFAFLALAATGLDALWRGRIEWRKWFWLPVGVLASLCSWCAFRLIMPPDTVDSGLSMLITQGGSFGWGTSIADVRTAQAWFARTYAVEALQCAAVIAAWMWLRYHKSLAQKFFPLLGFFMVADLLWLGYGRAVQSPPEQYYPKIPALQQIRASAPGRIMGYHCFQAIMGMMENLPDVRGYDAVDPARMTDVVLLSANSSAPYPYAVTQLMTPLTFNRVDEDLRLPPVLDMLGVRYLILRGPVLAGARPAFVSPDYWIMENKRALPRVYVPQRVETVTDDAVRLEKMKSRDFNALEIAYVESPLKLSNLCLGKAQITSETPTRITLSATMQTDGLVVLADNWDKGWRAYLDGLPTPILRANHTLRGVLVPAGTATVEFRYEPGSFTLGLKLAGLAAILLLGWSGYHLWTGRREKRRA